MSTETTRAVVAAYVAALQAGDLEALRAAFADDGTWTLKGDVPVAGTWTGPDEIFDGFLAQLVERLDVAAGVTQTLHRIVADGEYAVAAWTSRARARSGEPYVNDVAVMFHVVDGKIASAREYTDTSYLQRVLFGD
jgi:uncharacterized protein (TIGR02246 family)